MPELNRETKFKAALGFWDAVSDAKKDVQLLQINALPKSGLEFSVLINTKPTKITERYSFTGHYHIKSGEVPFTAGYSAGVTALRLCQDLNSNTLPQQVKILTETPDADRDILGWIE